MLLDFSDLGPRGVWIDRSVRLGEFPWSGGAVRSEPVHVAGHLRPTARGAELVGRFEARVELTCSRCLDPYRTDLRGRFRLLLVDTSDDPSEDPFRRIGEDDPDGVDLYPVAGESLDLAAVLREQIDLHLPYRAICQESCRGLCAGCGAALNREPCRCERHADPRWSALTDLAARLRNPPDDETSRR